jgi:hypothetical protein
MARRNKKQAALQETVADTAPAGTVETRVETVGGEVHVHRTVREWHPHAPETLPEIEAAIDSWGGFRSTETARQTIDLGDVGGKVDKLTRKVKGSRKVVVQETVTEWVEGPMGSGPVAVEDEDATPLHSRPRRRFRVLGTVGKKPKAAKAKRSKPKPKPQRKAKAAPRAKTTADDSYRPQCAALTADGKQCRNSARGASKYCAPHKGYQPPTAKGLAQRIEGDAWDPNDKLTDRQSVATADTRPRVRKAKDTTVKMRKPTRRKR